MRDDGRPGSGSGRQRSRGAAAGRGPSRAIRGPAGGVSAPRRARAGDAGVGPLGGGPESPHSRRRWRYAVSPRRAWPRRAPRRGTSAGIRSPRRPARSPSSGSSLLMGSAAASVLPAASGKRCAAARRPPSRSRPEPPTCRVRCGDRADDLRGCRWYRCQPGGTGADTLEDVEGRHGDAGKAQRPSRPQGCSTGGPRRSRGVKTTSPERVTEADDQDRRRRIRLARRAQDRAQVRDVSVARPRSPRPRAPSRSLRQRRCSISRSIAACERRIDPPRQRSTVFDSATARIPGDSETAHAQVRRALPSALQYTSSTFTAEALSGLVAGSPGRPAGRGAPFAFSARSGFGSCSRSSSSPDRLSDRAWRPTPIRAEHGAGRRSRDEGNVQSRNTTTWKAREPYGRDWVR